MERSRDSYRKVTAKTSVYSSTIATHDDARRCHSSWPRSTAPRRRARRATATAPSRGAAPTRRTAATGSTPLTQCRPDCGGEHGKHTTGWLCELPIEPPPPPRSPFTCSCAWTDPRTRAPAAARPGRSVGRRTMARRAMRILLQRAATAAAVRVASAAAAPQLPAGTPLLPPPRPRRRHRRRRRPPPSPPPPPPPPPSASPTPPPPSPKPPPPPPPSPSPPPPSPSPPRRCRRRMPALRRAAAGRRGRAARGQRADPAKRRHEVLVVTTMLVALLCCCFSGVTALLCIRKRCLNHQPPTRAATELTVATAPSRRWVPLG